jgi:hypothetical protein
LPKFLALEVLSKLLVILVMVKLSDWLFCRGLYVIRVKNTAIVGKTQIIIQALETISLL